MFSRWLALLGSASLLFFGCHKKSRNSGSFRAVQAERDKLKKLEARLFLDVPLFIDSSICSIAVSESDDSWIALINTSTDFSTLLEFYEREMAWAGWQLRARSNVGDTLFLYFEKPSCFCAFTFNVGLAGSNLITMTRGQKII